MSSSGFLTFLLTLVPGAGPIPTSGPQPLPNPIQLTTFSPTQDPINLFANYQNSLAYQPSSAPSAPSDPTLSNNPTTDPIQQQTTIPTTQPMGLTIGGPSMSSLMPNTNVSNGVFDIPANDVISYRPGVLSHEQAGLLLSQGLQAKTIALSGQRVIYSNGGTSIVPFHRRPDAGACIPDKRPDNEGGWIYVSNSEMRTIDPNVTAGQGGVGAITFDKDGKIIDYKRVLTNTTWNCGGGVTPWGTWVSCEERPDGRVYQVDPTGIRKAQKLILGSEGGNWESFTYDILNPSTPHFYLTEDAPRGAVQRFTPDVVTWDTDPWIMLHKSGKKEYLKLFPNPQGTGGRYKWISERNASRTNAKQFYPNVEGIDSDDGSLFFVSKIKRQLFILNLRNNTYTSSSTVRGKFDGQPDQVANILASGRNRKNKDDLLYFTEEGGNRAGVHGRNKGGKFVTIFESPVYKAECTGLAFSPNAMKMYIAYQNEGVLLEVSRMDGYPFYAKSLNIKYHNNQNVGGGGGAPAVDVDVGVGVGSINGKPSGAAAGGSGGGNNGNPSVSTTGGRGGIGAGNKGNPSGAAVGANGKNR